MCGRRGTFGTFIDVRGSSATTVDPWTPTVFYVAGVQHTTLLRLGLRGRRSAFSTFIDVRGSSATTVDPWTPTVFYVAGVTLSAPQARCVWQAWHFRYLHRCPRKLGDDGGPMDADCLLRGRRATHNTTMVDPWTPTVFYVAGVTLSAPQARCVWQAWHFRYLHRCPRKLGDDGGPMDADCLLRGRRETHNIAQTRFAWQA